MFYCKSIKKRYSPFVLDRGENFIAFYIVDGIQLQIPIYKNCYATLELAEKFFNLQLIRHARAWPVKL